MMTDDEVMNKVEEWHRSDSDLELHEYLGWTFEEYALWVSNGTLPDHAR